MVTVRKHSKRRLPAYQPKQAPPNALYKGNTARLAAGLRPIHVHRNNNIVDLGRSLTTHSDKAVYGWLRTQVSLLAADIARRAAKNQASYRPVINDVSRESRIRRETLVRLAQAQHKMECILAETLPGTVEPRQVRHRVLPTTQNVASGEDRASIDGWVAVPNALRTLAETDERYAPVLALIDPDLPGRV